MKSFFVGGGIHSDKAESFQQQPSIDQAQPVRSPLSQEPQTSSNGEKSPVMEAAPEIDK